MNLKMTKPLKEKDITKQVETIQLLMNEGLWPAPGGAWCSAGIPILRRNERMRRISAI